MAGENLTITDKDVSILRVDDYPVNDETIKNLSAKWGKVPETMNDIATALSEIRAERFTVRDKHAVLKAPITARGKALDKEAKRLMDACLALEAPLVEAQVQIKEAKEKEKEAKKEAARKRIAEIKSGIQEIAGIPNRFQNSTSDEVLRAIQGLEAMDLQEELYQEFIASAEAAKEASLTSLKGLLDSIEEREKAEAKLAEEKKAFEEQKAIEKEVREKREAKDLKEKKEREAQEQAERDSHEIAEQEERDRKQKEIDDENVRIKAEQYEENARLAEEKRKQDAENERIKGEQKEAQDKIDAQKAELHRIEQEKEAKELEERLDRENAEIEASNKLKKEEDEKKRYQSDQIVRSQAVNALNGILSSDTNEAEEVFDAIIEGEIPHVEIKWE